MGVAGVNRLQAYYHLSIPRMKPSTFSGEILKPVNTGILRSLSVVTRSTVGGRDSFEYLSRRSTKTVGTWAAMPALTSDTVSP